MKRLLSIPLILIYFYGTAQPVLVSTDPAAHAVNVVQDANIVLTFSSAVTNSTINLQNIAIHGDQSGLLAGVFSGGGTNIVTFDPDQNFKPGEIITVDVTDGVMGGGLPLTNPQVFRFHASSGPAIPPDNATGTVISSTVDGLLSIVAGDIDGDGDIDILSGSALDDAIAWHENSGGTNPTFTKEVISTLGDQVYDVELGDLNGDGSLDLLRASAGDHRLAWFQNDGAPDPTFSGYVISSSILGIRGIATGDINNDGHLDIVSAAFLGDEIAWHENDGNSPTPGFSSHHVISSSADGAYAVATGDLDGDGDLDVISASYDDNRIAWYENDGSANPSFTTITLSSTMLGATDVTTADLDNDGDLDIIATSSEDNKLAWFENNGAANPSFTGHVISLAGTQASSTSVYDLDGDGDLDILRTSIGNNTAAWFENDGNANPNFAGHVISNSINDAIDIIAADLNQDNRLDVITASLSDDEIRWFDATLRPLLVSTTPMSNAVNVSAGVNITMAFDATIDAGTVNGNNIMVHSSLTGQVPGNLSGAGTSTIVFNPSVDFLPGDLVTVTITAGLQHDGIDLANPTNTQFTVTSSGHDPQVFSKNILNGTAGNIGDIEVCDLDGDGDLDLVACNVNADALKWYRNDGASPPAFTPVIIDPVSFYIEDVEIGDLDGDGDLDVLVGTTISNQGAIWYESNGASNPSFTKRVLTAPSPSSLGIADMDADGDLDFVLASAVDDELLWYRNNGAPDPVFSEFTITTTSANTIRDLTLGDVNGDGNMDVIGAIYGSGKIRWFENDGGVNPSFIVHDASNFAGVITVGTGDMDGDGDLDLLGYSKNAHAVFWFENDGGSVPAFTGHAVNENAVSTNQFNSGLLAVDIDGDSNLDVLSASSSLDDFVWYRNDGAQDPVFTSTQLIAPGTSQNFLATGDLDNDGDLEIITTYQNSGDLIWYGSQSLPVLESIAPAPNAVDLDLDQNIVMTFSNPMDTFVYPFMTDTMNIVMYGSESGLIEGTFSGVGTPEIIFDPVGTYRPGEVLSLSLTQNLNYIGFPLGMPVVANYSVTSEPVEDHEYVKQLLTSQTDKPTDVITADVNNDGHLDFIASSYDLNEIAWWRNQGLPYPTFTKHVISTNMMGASSVEVGDMNADDLLDIVATSALDNKISIFFNQGGNIPLFNETVLSTLGMGSCDAKVGDLNGDGTMDIVRASYNDDKVAIILASGTNNLSYSGHLVSSVEDSVVSVDLGDLDGDGDLDILSAAFNDHTIKWFENNGAPIPGFTEHTVTSTAYGVTDITTGDIDGDGDLDFVAASFLDDRLAWYENNGNANPTFSRHTISTFGDGTNSVAVADIDADGDLDVFRTSFLDHRISWFENDGAPVPTFSGSNIATGILFARNIATGDLDGDGDIDVMTTSFLSNEVLWFETDYPKDTEVRRENGTVTVTDINGGTSNDRLSLFYDDNYLTVTDPVMTLRAIGFQTEEIDSHTVKVYMGGTTSVSLDGKEGLDSVFLDFTDAFGSKDLNIDKVTYIQNQPGSLISTTDGLITLKAEHNIDVFGTLSSSSGNITLQANQQLPSGSGNFNGITVYHGASIMSNTGDISISGKGGNNTEENRNNIGVSVEGGTIKTIGSGPGAGNLVITGTGGAVSTLPGYGIYLSFDTTPGTLSLLDGTMTLTGTSTGVPEIMRSNGGLLSVTGIGTIRIQE